MGQKSKSERKESDNVLIQTPEQFNKITKSRLPELASANCPPSIQEKLEDDPLLFNDALIYLDRFGDRFKIMLQGNQIGLLSKRNSERISDCIELGVGYIGKVYLKKGEFYATFIRKTS